MNNIDEIKEYVYDVDARIKCSVFAKNEDEAADLFANSLDHISGVTCMSITPETYSPTKEIILEIDEDQI